jgi:hypothetical protein
MVPSAARPYSPTFRSNPSHHYSTRRPHSPASVIGEIEAQGEQD